MSIDLTKPVQTRSGLKARVLCTDRKGDQPVIVLVQSENGNETFESYNKDGSWAVSGKPHDMNLVNVPEEKVSYINAYPDIYQSLKRAQSCASPTAKQVKLTWVDGKIIKAEPV